MLKEKPIGRPPHFSSCEQMQESIDKYFELCEGKVLTDSEGKAVLDKHDQPVIVDRKPPTVTGLALALGFTSRQALLNYQAKKAFVDTVTRAKSRVEQYTEERLFDRDGANGAKFSLANNFDGWKEKKHVEADVKEDVVIAIELVDDEEDEAEDDFMDVNDGE